MGYNLEQIQDVWNRSLTAENITETIMAISLFDDVSKGIKLMEKNRFDILGLRDESGRVVGYIEVDGSLKGSCEEHCQTFEIESLVSLQTPLKDCMSHIVGKKRLFVLGSVGIEGIITLADLHKQPVRMLLFSVVSLLEMTMGQLIKSYYPNDLWCDKVPDGRLEKAKELFDERNRVGQEIDLGDCLQLCDKCRILSTTDIWEDWEFDSKSKANDFFNAITELRNNLAHSQEQVWSDISKIIDLCNTAEGMIETNINTISADIWEAVIDGR